MYKRTIHRILSTDAKIQTAVNWDKNRPPDMCRVKDIVNDMNDRIAQWVDGLILLWKKGPEQYICYDGIHRIEACRRLGRKVEVMVQVRENCPESIIMGEFLRINKSIPISSLYSLAEQELTMKKTIEAVVRYYQEAYPEFFKPSAKPRVPHSNRDVMMETLYEMTIENPKRKTFSMQDWLGELESIEKRIHANPSIKLTLKQKNKCESYNFWLFACSKWSSM